MGVSTQHEEYSEALADWQICRDVIAGQRAMHKAGERHLPKLIDETDAMYKARLKRSNFFNGSWRTVSGMLGLMWRKDPKQEIPAAIKPHTADVTMSGKSLETLAKNVCFEVLATGRVGIMVDHPRVDNVVGLTRADQERIGLRPTLQLYEAESIINWEYRTIRNATTLAMVVLKECARIRTDEFTFKEEDRYRVLDLNPEAGNTYRVRVFKVDEKAKKDVLLEEFVPLMNGQPLDFIPFKIVGTEGGDSDCDDPALIDLFTTNIALYQVNSDRRHGLHFTGLPLLFTAGIQLKEGDNIVVGSAAALSASDPNAKAMYVEFQGKGLGELKDYSMELKQEMAVLGARMLADEARQVETLGATIIKRTGENSILASIAGSVSEAMEWALGVFSRWAGADGKVVYQINRDFMPMPLDAQQLTALVGSWQSGALSDVELYDRLQKGEIIDAEKPFEMHQAEVEMQAPPMPAPAPQQAAA